MASTAESLRAAYEASVAEGYEEYCKACYGDRELPATQMAETRQAFISGIHWLASLVCGDMANMQLTLRGLVIKDYGVRASETPTSEPTPES